jgi:hypothetical protein
VAAENALRTGDAFWESLKMPAHLEAMSVEHVAVVNQKLHIDQAAAMPLNVVAISELLEQVDAVLPSQSHGALPFGEAIRTVLSLFADARDNEYAPAVHVLAVKTFVW